MKTSKESNVSILRISAANKEENFSSTSNSNKKRKHIEINESIEDDMFKLNDKVLVS